MKNGLRLEGKKEASLISWAIRRPPSPPSRVRIPLIHSISGGSSVPCVRVGARVRVGEKIARPLQKVPGSKRNLVPFGDFPSTTAVHASISGEVTAIACFPHPVLGEAEAIEIQSDGRAAVVADGRDEAAEDIGKERLGWQELDRQTLLRILRDCGVGPSSMSFPNVSIGNPKLGSPIEPFGDDNSRPLGTKRNVLREMFSSICSLAMTTHVFLEMIKFEHSIFALPFAYLGLILAEGGWPRLSLFIWVTLAMVSFRTMGMALNRLIDAEIDARNPRTKNRALPTGKLKSPFVWAVTFLAFVLFEFFAWKLGPICFQLSPIPVILAWVYPFAKRFTWLSHFVLGIILGIAPYGPGIKPSQKNRNQ
jgi:hypothetical protein